MSILFNLIQPINQPNIKSLIKRKLVTIIRMEDQCPNLNTLPSSLMLSLRIHKRAMRHATSPSIRLGIETFN